MARIFLRYALLLPVTIIVPLLSRAQAPSPLKIEMQCTSCSEEKKQEIEQIVKGETDITAAYNKVAKLFVQRKDSKEWFKLICRECKGLKMLVYPAQRAPETTPKPFGSLGGDISFIKELEDMFSGTLFLLDTFSLKVSDLIDGQQLAPYDIRLEPAGENSPSVNLYDVKEGVLQLTAIQLQDYGLNTSFYLSAYDSGGKQLLKNKDVCRLHFFTMQELNALTEYIRQYRQEFPREGYPAVIKQVCYYLSSAYGKVQESNVTAWYKKNFPDN